MTQTIKQGRFITIEGIEGAGKSTLQNFIADYLQQHLGQTVLKTREPGGTVIAESIRQTLLQHHSEKMVEDCELLLLFAARAQHVQTLIQPQLQSGQWIICDRFTDASYAYQGGGRGIDVTRLQTLENWVLKGFQPDLTILLDLPVTVAVVRLQNRQLFDRIEVEKTEFFTRVREAYLHRAKQFPDRIKVCDASGDLDSVQQQIKALLETYLLQ